MWVTSFEKQHFALAQLNKIYNIDCAQPTVDSKCIFSFDSNLHVGLFYLSVICLPVFNKKNANIRVCVLCIE